MATERLLDFRETLFHPSSGHQLLAHADEGAHHVYAHAYGSRTVEDIGSHYRAVLGERIWQVFDVLAPLQDHRL